MSIVDSRGRLFGRINLVDAAALLFVAFLIPVGYATFLLFRPARPAIESVTLVEVSREERRVGGGSLVAAKLKVKGSGFNPLLRAGIGNVEALGFVFENPNSADVLVPAMPAGRHDLVLYDGVQEVARAVQAVELHAANAPQVRIFGWFTHLPPHLAAAIRSGFKSEDNAPGAFEVVAVGETRKAGQRIGIGAMAVDLPIEGHVERPAEVLVHCDWPGAGGCSIGGMMLTLEPPIRTSLPGGYGFEIEEVAPPTLPSSVTARVQFTGAPLMKPGDRDAFIGSHAAVVAAIDGGPNPTATLRLGAYESREGWRYRGRLLAPGAPFTFRTAGYVASGTVIGVTAGAGAQP